MSRSYVASAITGAFVLGLATAAIAAAKGEFNNLCTMGLAAHKIMHTDCSVNTKPLAHQIAHPKGHVYPGDLHTGQSYLHLEDLVDAVSRLIERRNQLPPELPLLLGEPEVVSYGVLPRP